MRPSRFRPLASLFALASVVALVAAGCGSHRATAPAAPTRSWFMGFSGDSPEPTFASVLATLELARAHSDAAIVHDSPPWDSLFAGVAAETLVVRNVTGLVAYWRGHGMTVTYEIDGTDGLDRSAEDPALVRLGHSIAEPATRALFLRWATAVDSLARPDYLGLASETNLVRAVAPPTLYAALVQLARGTADSLAARHARWHRDRDPVLYSTVQVEVAWGGLLSSTHTYAGIATDLADFPFGGALGLSSYPYLGGFAEPESLPADYYSRIAHDAGRPVMVVEGGWMSVSGSGIVSTPQKQARYVRVQSRLLAAAHALGCYQLTFTDLDLANWPVPPSGSLVPFAFNGLVDIALAPKPALAPWDSVFALRRAP